MNDTTQVTVVPPVDPQPGAGNGEGSARRGFRPEIQAMRAVAVLAVVAYHVWPARFPGGYVGVDVFFVLSGFLITGNMVREVARTGRLSLSMFWASRVRRILPASLVAIAVTCVAATYLLPPTELHRTADDAVAATLYAINWVLAGQSVQYLAPTNDPTIYQHYWSLAVEEQFYLIWPVLIAVVMVVLRQVRRARKGYEPEAGARLTRPARLALLAVFLILVVASFLYSLRLAGVDPTVYFVTTARLWELGIGALLALVPVGFSLPGAVRTAFGVVALALVGYASFAFNDATPFPGLAALIPTGASALLILSGPLPATLGLKRLSELPPVQWVGNISYSLYLWHFPVIIIWTAMAGARPGVANGLIVIAVGIILAACSYCLVENPIRYSPWLRARPWTTLLIFAVAMGLTVATTGLPRMRESQLLSQGVSTDSRVQIGKQGWLYLNLGDNLRLPEPSFRVRPKLVASMVTSQQRITAYYAALGTGYYVGIPPSKTTVYPEFMHEDNLKVGVTPADTLLGTIASETGAGTIDLKAAVLAAKDKGKVYRQLDTHWTNLGAYAGYSAIIARLTKDGALPAQTRPVSVTFTEGRSSGELAQMLGTDWTEALPMAQWDAHSTEVTTGPVYDSAQKYCTTPCVATVLQNASAPQRTLFIYGDSFSAVTRQLPRWLAEHFSTVILITSGQPIIPELEAEVHPDVVLYLPTERSAAGVLANAAKRLP